MANEADLAAAYQAALDTHAAAEAAYDQAVAAHGPAPDAILPASEHARQLEHDADTAWEAHHGAWHDLHHPETSAGGKGDLDTLDRDLRPHPHAEAEAG